MTCLAILAPVLLSAANCAPADLSMSAAPTTMVVRASAMRDARPLPDPKLAQVRGGRIYRGEAERRLQEASVRGMTLGNPYTAQELVDTWWATTGADLIAANIAR